MSYDGFAVPFDIDDFAQAIQSAVRAVPPAWPLASSVAVNPYLGQANEPLQVAGARLARVAGARVTMPRAWFHARIARGAIEDVDLSEALEQAPPSLRPANLAALKAAAATEPESRAALPTVADLAAQASGVDWPAVIADRLGVFAADHFDAGQALWAAPRGRGLYAAWRAVATHDLTPEILGLSDFAQHVADAPEDARTAVARAAARLDLSPLEARTYFHQLLLTLGGWSQIARHRLWEAELAGGEEQTPADLLAVRLVWEEALHIRYVDRIGDAWTAARQAHAAPLDPTSDLTVDSILQTAAERAAQRRLAKILRAPAPAPATALGRSALQAVFCIDVRSEVFRRALESLDPGVRTLGFAGFFGLAALHRGFASDVDEKRLPVLLNPSVRSCSGGAEVGPADRSERFKARARRAWGRFKIAAVSSFAFVEAAGPLYAVKLLSDALGRGRAPGPDKAAPRLDPPMPLEERINAAWTVLHAMSLTSEFARVVLLAGHGASVVNNPHASALHCGACGGYAGDVNARLLAALLNDRDVREGLAGRGLIVPADTLFVAALHDTTTDEVSLFDLGDASFDHASDIARVRAWLAKAGALARSERLLRLPGARSEASVVQRSRDWSQTRPEWALAGCMAFIAAPRGRTAGKSLEGRAFLHDYDWRKDEGFGVLELILTAPVVVASWISLQYYGSTVSPELFGAGNKLLHNAIGGIGVIEGNRGLLRAGLPWQSVHDGEDHAHEPLRLSVCVEAPREAMADILERHDGVRALFDNGWLHLFALDDRGRMAWRYAGDLRWTEVAAEATDEPPVSTTVV